MIVKETISHPMINKAVDNLFVDKPHLKENGSALLSEFTTGKTKRAFSSPKGKLSSFIKQPLLCRSKTTTEPIVYYNGPCETLDQLPEDKYRWITSESFDMNSQPANPLLSCPRSIVLRKPHHINASGFGHRNTQRPKAKGTFYMRVLQINSQYSSKGCNIKPAIKIGDEVFYGSYASSRKRGKVGTQAIMDETYLIDFYGETAATLSLYSRSRSPLGSISSRFKKPDICFGSYEFNVSISPSEKKIERITLRDGETEDQYQILVVYGTYVCKNVMILLQNELIYKGYITVYTKGRATPRWNRYWATLSPEGFDLYDFEYKEKRNPVYSVPLNSFLSIFHPPIDDDERLVDVGSLGLALQFSEHVLDKTESVPEALEHRIYILPDDQKSSKEWEAAFKQIADLIKEYRFDECFYATRFYSGDKSMCISTKFLW